MTYLLTSELYSTGAGLCAAGMIAIVPGYISRSVAGSYDNEAIAIFCMLFTYYLWIKSVKTGKIYWAALCSVPACADQRAHAGPWSLWTLPDPLLRRLPPSQYDQRELQPALQKSCHRNRGNNLHRSCHSHTFWQGCALDRKILLSFGSQLCQEQYSDHRECV